MINPLVLRKISVFILMPLMAILITFATATVLILNTNYLETGILQEQTIRYQYLADDFSDQIAASESLLQKLENNPYLASILKTEHANDSDPQASFDMIDLETLIEDSNEALIYERLTIYTTNDTVLIDEKFDHVSEDVLYAPWYTGIIQSRRKWLLYVNDNKAQILYKIEYDDAPNDHTHVGVVTLDLSLLSRGALENHQVIFTNVASNKVSTVAGDRTLSSPLSAYFGISESTYVDDDMVLAYVVVAGTTATRWTLLIVLEPSNYIYEFITYAIAILSVFLAIAYVFYYRHSFMKKLERSSHDLSFDEVQDIVAKNQPTKVEAIVSKMYERIDLLVKRNQELDIINQQKEAQKNEAEIKALLSQINPHYIFNMLNSIHKRALKNHEMESAKMILLMSKQLRRSLEWKDPFVTIKDEIEHIKSYIALNEYYSGTTHQIIYDMDQTLYAVKVPKLILQTLIENALKHGIDSAPIHIRLDEKDGLVRVTVRNEVIGSMKVIQDHIKNALEANELSGDNEGIGLQNMARRMKYYYGDNCHIGTHINKQNISVTVSFPKQ